MAALDAITPILETLVGFDTVSAKSNMALVQWVRDYLARHGVNVVVDQLPSGGRRVQDVLNSHALEVGADLIVMGAYGHSRLRERVFGGVTQSMLEECEVPVLIAR